MLDKLAAFADQYDMFPENGLILAAVSGGADSMCLLMALLALSCPRGFSVAAAHYNHGLRGAESDRDADFVQNFCREHHIPLSIGKGDVCAFARSSGLGIEEAARSMRYEFLIETAKKTSAKRIATAHTADDNAETVLLNLARGAGLTGLAGIPPTRGEIIRPMLSLTRNDVIDFLASRNISFVEDSTNALDIYARNAIRHHVIPVLKEINPRLSEHISVMTSLIRADEAYINDKAEQYIHEHQTYSGGVRSLDAAGLYKLPRPVSSRVLRQIYGSNLSSAHIFAVLALCAPGIVSGEIKLPGGSAIREYDRLVLTNAAEVSGFATAEITVGCSTLIPELSLTVTCRLITAINPYDKKINKSFTTFLFKYDSICGKIVIRPRETGDKIDLFGRNGTKTLKKLFIERRIPRRLRSLLPVVADEKGVLAVYGIGMDKRAAYDAGDQVLEITFEETAYEK